MTAPFKAGSHDDIESSLFQHSRFFRCCCGANRPYAASMTIIQYFRGRNSVDEAEYGSARVKRGMNLFLEVLWPGFHIKWRPNA